MSDTTANTADSQEDLIVINGETGSLAELSNMSLEEIEEHRDTVLPVGQYVFKGLKYELTAEIQTNRKTDEKESIPVVKFSMEIAEVRVIPKYEGNKDELVGRVHTERFNIRDMRKDVGRIKAFMSDIGRPMARDGSLNSIPELWDGAMFIAMVKNRNDRNDSDIVYVSLNRDKKKLAPYVG